MSTYTVSIVNRTTGSIEWSHVNDDIELIAGILSAGVRIVQKLNDPAGDLYIDSNADVSTYRRLHQIKEAEVTPIIASNNIKPGTYGLWVPSTHPYRYDLYMFRRPTFFQGIIFICQEFNVDYRDYVYRLPVDHRGLEFTFQGYHLITTTEVVEVTDDFDIDAEEADNENIIEPLKKDY